MVGNLFQVIAEDPRWKGKTGDLAPERFYPERWLLKEVVEIGAGSFIPWGGGPRTCLGMPLAMAELKVILAVLARGYEFELESKEVEWTSDPLPLPVGGLPMRVRKL